MTELLTDAIKATLIILSLLALSGGVLMWWDWKSENTKSNNSNL